MILEWVAEREVGVNLIAVASADLGVRQIPGGLELSHNPLRRSFCDADLDCNIANPNIWITRNAQKNMRVVGQEGPALFFD